jgi:hypothetical protein
MLLTGTSIVVLLAGSYMAIMYLGAVYYIKEETKRKNKEDSDV